MKKKLLYIGIMLLIGLFIAVGCSGGSGGSQDNSSSGSSANQQSSQSTKESSDNSGGSDSANSSGSSDSSSQTTSSGATQNSMPNVVGDWKYEGAIDSGSYEISLDLEGDGRFELEIDQDTPDDIEDSKATGTYVADDKTIKLSVATVQDVSGSFTGAVVQNEQVDLNYTLSDDGRSLTLSNAADSIAILPGELVLYRD